MNRKSLLILELFFSIINNNKCKRCEKYTESLYNKTTVGPFTHTGLTCGKSHPVTQKDCTQFGTDSGMYCCWVALDENDEKGQCHLISGKKIERNHIDGCAQFIDSYWSCGNFSNNIKINIILLVILIFFFLHL